MDYGDLLPDQSFDRVAYKVTVRGLEREGYYFCHVKLCLKKKIEQINNASPLLYCK